jgi:hypothetical protein
MKKDISPIWRVTKIRLFIYEKNILKTTQGFQAIHVLIYINRNSGLIEIPAPNSLKCLM